jgi:tRNA pseudouridine65 synthase
MPELKILALTDDWVVVAKPPRLLVHRTKLFAQDRWFALQIVRDQLGRHVYPVARLDRSASGCLVMGLSSDAARALQEAMADPSAEKTYLAHVRGLWRHEGVVEVDQPVLDEGVRKEAFSLVESIGTCAEPRCSLLRVRPRTGRNHQVRRHVRDLNHPILGDPEHGDGKLNRWWRENRGLERLGLHCLRLDLPLPGGGRLVTECPLFEDHRRLWSALPWWEDAVRAEPMLGVDPLPLLDLPADPVTGEPEV